MIAHTMKAGHNTIVFLEWVPLSECSCGVQQSKPSPFLAEEAGAYADLMLP